ncbi:MAG: SPFH domain-containing protein, partial [Pseudonocardiaceae bacterium]
MGRRPAVVDDSLVIPVGAPVDVILSFVIPYIDRVYPAIDLREQVVSFAPQPVITEDNLVVEIDTV